MDNKFVGIVLKVIDYKEKDKLINIFSANEGLVLGKLKSVKGQSSKLKVLASPFCLAEFTVASNNGNNVITGGTVIDAFFDITSDIEKYLAGCCVIDFAMQLLKYNTEDNEQLFSLLVNTLKGLNYYNVDAKILLIKFLFEVISIYGFELNINKCICGKEFTDLAYIDLISGDVKCENCINNKILKITNPELKVLRDIKNLNIEKDSQFDCDSELLGSILRLLGNYIYNQFNYKIKINDLINQF